MRRNITDTPIRTGVTRWIAALTSFSLAWSAIAAPLAEASIWSERKEALSRARETERSSGTLVNVREHFRKSGPQQLQVPEELGSVVEHWPPRPETAPAPDADQPLIIHIQDAHGMVGAQKNAVALLNWIDLQRTQWSKSPRDPLLVCVEGAWTQANPDWMSAYPDKGVKKKVADYLLERSEIAGEEYLAILENPGKLDIEGVEDRELYLSNLASRQIIDRKRGEILAAYGEFQKRLRRIELKVGGAELVRFGERASAFADHALGARDYFLYLNSLAPRWSAQEYPNLALFQQAIDGEKSVPASRVEAARGELMRTFSRKLSPADLSALAQLSLEYRLGTLSSLEFHSGLAALAQTLGAPAQTLAAHAANLRIHDAIDFSKMNAEMAELERMAGESLIRKLGREEKIMELGRLLREQAQFWDQKLTPSGYGGFRQIQKMSWNEMDEILRNLESKYGLAGVAGGDGARTSADASFAESRYIQEAYYKLALKRDEAMAHRAIEKVKEKGAPVAVLIAGGFHSAGMTQHFRKQGIPYVVIQPRLNAANEAALGLSAADVNGSRSKSFADKNFAEKNLAGYVSNLKNIAASREPGRSMAEQMLDLIKNRVTFSRAFERDGKTYCFTSYRDGDSTRSVLIEFSESRKPAALKTARAANPRAPPAQRYMLRDAALMSGSHSGRMPALTISLLSQAAVGGGKEISGLTDLNESNIEAFLTGAPFILAVPKGTDLIQLQSGIRQEINQIFGGTIQWKLETREETDRTLLRLTFSKRNAETVRNEGYQPDSIPAVKAAAKKPASLFGSIFGGRGAIAQSVRAVLAMMLIVVGMHFFTPTASAHYFNEQGAVVETWTWAEPAQNTLYQIEIDALTRSGHEVSSENLAKIRQQILELNPGLGDNPSLIYPGQQIAIPAEYMPAADVTPEPGTDGGETVVPGTPVPGDGTPAPGATPEPGGTTVPGTPTPSATATPSPTGTATPSPTGTPTPSATATPTQTRTQLPTAAASPASLAPTQAVGTPTPAGTSSDNGRSLMEWGLIAAFLAGAAGIISFFVIKILNRSKSGISKVGESITGAARAAAGGRIGSGLGWASTRIGTAFISGLSVLRNGRVMASLALITAMSVAEEWIFRSEVFGRGFDWTNSLFGAAGLSGNPLNIAAWGTALMISIPGFALYHMAINKGLSRKFSKIYDRNETLKQNFKFRMPAAAVFVFLFLQFPAVSILGAEAHWNVIAHVAYNLVAYPLGRSLLCGNIGILQARRDKDDEIVPGSVMRVLNRMGGVTKIRGEQAAGMTVFAEDGKGNGKTLTERIVNPKRLNLPDQLQKAVTSKLKRSSRFGTKASKDTLMIVGHYRYGTSSAPAVKETHPHQWMPSRIARVWSLENGKYAASNKPVSTVITHNGDFDYWNIFGDEQPNDQIGLWLEHVLHSPNDTKGDSPKIAGMMDLLLTQGMWDASARLAYQLTVASSFKDAFDGQEPSKSGPNTAPSIAQLQKWAAIFEGAFEPRKNILARRDAEDWRVLGREAAKALETDAVAKDWTREQRENFAAAAVEAFRENDLYRSTQKFMAGAIGSFGLATATALEGDHVVLSARGQPLSIGIDPDNQRMFYVSEPAALKVMLEESEGEVYRWDLDQKRGEILDLRLDGWRLYSEQLGREFTQDEIARSGRLIEMKDNPYMSRLNEDAPGDPVGDDIRDIPKVLAQIQQDWATPDSKNRQTADEFAKKIIEKVSAPSRGRDRRAVDVLITGIESSIWIGERFGEDLRRIFPELNILPVSSNKLLEGQLAIDSETLVLAISQSGQTFPTLNALIGLVEGQDAREKTPEDPHNIFVMTGEMDSLLGLAVGQKYYRSAPFSKRIFVNGSGRRPAEPSTVAAASTHATLTELFLHVARSVRAEHPQGEPLGMKLTAAEIEELARLQSQLVNEHAVQITGADAEGNKVDSKVHDDLVKQGRKWGLHVLENAIVTLATALFVFITVMFGIPVFGTSIAFADTLGIPGSGAYQSLGPVANIPDALTYVFFAFMFTIAFRRLTGRTLLARMGKRTLVIGDQSYVHQLLESNVSKIFSMSYGFASLDVHGGNPRDHMVHRFGHRINRGTLMWLGRQDGRIKTLANAEASVQMTGKQAKGVQNWGVGAEVVTVGQNPSYNPNAADNHIVLPESARLSHVSDDLAQLFETRIDSFQRLLSGYVLFHAMGRTVSRAPIISYDMSRSQSGTRVATTASPVSGAGIFENSADDAPLSLLAEPVMLPFTVKTTPQTVEADEWAPAAETVEEDIHSLGDLASAHGFTVRQSLEHIDLDVLKRRVKFLTAHGIKVTAPALSPRGFLNAIANAGRRPNEVRTPSPEASARLAAEKIADVIRANNAEKRRTNLGTGTGDHARLLYRELGRIRQQTGLDFSNVHIFGMDALAVPHLLAEERRLFIETYLIQHLNIPAAHRHFMNLQNLPDAQDAADWSIQNLTTKKRSSKAEQKIDYKAEAARFEEEIRANGGITIQVLDLTERLSWSHASLHFESRSRLYAPEIIGGERRQLLGMGGGTVLDAKEIIALSDPHNIPEFLSEASREKTIAPSLPLSYMRIHPNITFYISETSDVSGRGGMSALADRAAKANERVQEAMTLIVTGTWNRGFQYASALVDFFKGLFGSGSDAGSFAGAPLVPASVEAIRTSLGDSSGRLEEAAEFNLPYSWGHAAIAAQAETIHKKELYVIDLNETFQLKGREVFMSPAVRKFIMGAVEAARLRAEANPDKPSAFAFVLDSKGAAAKDAALAAKFAESLGIDENSIELITDSPAQMMRALKSKATQIDISVLTLTPEAWKGFEAEGAAIHPLLQIGQDVRLTGGKAARMRELIIARNEGAFDNGALAWDAQKQELTLKGQALAGDLTVHFGRDAAIFEIQQ